MTRSELNNLSKDINSALHIYQETFGTYDEVIAALKDVVAKYGKNRITNYLWHLMLPNRHISEVDAYRRLATFSNGIELTLLSMD